LVRGFANLLTLDWRVADGWFARAGIEHSWLWRRDEDGERIAILDVYPVGAVCPQLVDGSFSSPWYHLYMDAPRAYSEDVIGKWKLEGQHAWEKFLGKGGTIQCAT
jgi:hypothetical protein